MVMSYFIDDSEEMVYPELVMGLNPVLKINQEIRLLHINFVTPAKWLFRYVKKAILERLGRPKDVVLSTAMDAKYITPSRIEI